jgi:hypothetical protein
MDGQKMKDITKEVGVSRTRAQEWKLGVVKNLTWAIYEENKRGKEKVLSWWEYLFLSRIIQFTLISNLS